MKLKVGKQKSKEEPTHLEGKNSGSFWPLPARLSRGRPTRSKKILPLPPPLLSSFKALSFSTDRLPNSQALYNSFHLPSVEQLPTSSSLVDSHFFLISPPPRYLLWDTRRRRSRKWLVISPSMRAAIWCRTSWTKQRTRSPSATFPYTEILDAMTGATIASPRKAGHLTRTRTSSSSHPMNLIPNPCRRRASSSAARSSLTRSPSSPRKGPTSPANRGGGSRDGCLSCSSGASRRTDHVSTSMAVCRTVGGTYSCSGLADSRWRWSWGISRRGRAASSGRHHLPRSLLISRLTRRAGTGPRVVMGSLPSLVACRSREIHETCPSPTWNSRSVELIAYMGQYMIYIG